VNELEHTAIVATSTVQQYKTMFLFDITVGFNHF